MIPILSVRMPNGTVIDIPALVGRRGVSITDIKRTSGDGSPGSTDTYTIALSDGGTHDFQVYHGKDGSGSGDMLAAVYDPRGKRQDIFAYVESLIPTLESLGAEASGSAAKALTDAKSYTDTKIADLINSAPTTLDTLGEIATAMEENADVVDALDAAVGSKAAAADLTGHTGNKSNPHGVTAEQVGALPLSGGTINGELTVNSSLRVVSDQPVEIGRYLDFHTGKDDASDYSGRMILNPDTGNVEWSNAVDGNKSGFVVTTGNLKDAIRAAGIELGVDNGATFVLAAQSIQTTRDETTVTATYTLPIDFTASYIHLNMPSYAGAIKKVDGDGASAEACTYTFDQVSDLPLYNGSYVNIGANVTNINGTTALTFKVALSDNIITLTATVSGYGNRMQGALSVEFSGKAFV